MVNMDIRTRVELKNETIRGNGRQGKAGKVALIGAFPSSKSTIYAATTFSQVVSHYGVKLNSTAVKNYGGVKAARRIFMDGIDGYSGASSISCINICTLKPTKNEPVFSDYKETYTEEEITFQVQEAVPVTNGTVNEAITEEEDAIAADRKLTFEKLKKALNQIADEDMDILFIACDLWEIFDYPEQTYTLWTQNNQKYRIPIYRYIIDKNGDPTIDKNGEPVLNTENLIHYWDNADKTSIKTAAKVPTGKTPVLYNEIVNQAKQPIHFEIKKDANGNKIYLMETLIINDETIYGITPTGKYIRNIGDVYDYILDFIDNEFTTHKPVNYIGAVFTRADVEEDTLTGIGSKFLRVNGLTLTSDDDGYKESPADNPYVNTKTWGAVEIADLFTRETNELSTCGLYYQEGIINGEEVDRIELAAHMCGFTCSIPLSQDLTYQTIPGLTSIKEEAYLGLDDAGTILNEHGIQVIRPKDRLEKTFYVNNSVQPTGWHTNHVRTVTYLLKRLQFESGLGINNGVINLEAYRALLENAVKEVLDECDVLKEVTIGQIEIISSYHIFVPVTIVLVGVITRINVGVSMALDENGETTTYIKSTNGYSMTV